MEPPLGAGFPDHGEKEFAENTVFPKFVPTPQKGEVDIHTSQNMGYGVKWSPKKATGDNKDLRKFVNAPHFVHSEDGAKVLQEVRREEELVKRAGRKDVKKKSSGEKSSNVGADKEKRFLAVPGNGAVSSLGISSPGLSPRLSQSVNSSPARVRGVQNVTTEEKEPKSAQNSPKATPRTGPTSYLSEMLSSNTQTMASQCMPTTGIPADAPLSAAIAFMLDNQTTYAPICKSTKDSACVGLLGVIDIVANIINRMPREVLTNARILYLKEGELQPKPADVSQCNSIIHAVMDTEIGVCLSSVSGSDRITPNITADETETLVDAASSFSTGCHAMTVINKKNKVVGLLTLARFHDIVYKQLKQPHFKWMNVASVANLLNPYLDSSSEDAVDQIIAYQQQRPAIVDVNAKTCLLSAMEQLIMARRVSALVVEKGATLISGKKSPRMHGSFNDEHIIQLFRLPGYLKYLFTPVLSFVNEELLRVTQMPLRYLTCRTTNRVADVVELLATGKTDQLIVVGKKGNIKGCATRTDVCEAIYRKVKRSFYESVGVSKKEAVAESEKNDNKEKELRKSEDDEANAGNSTRKRSERRKYLKAYFSSSDDEGSESDGEDGKNEEAKAKITYQPKSVDDIFGVTQSTFKRFDPLEYTRKLNKQAAAASSVKSPADAVKDPLARLNEWKASVQVMDEAQKRFLELQVANNEQARIAKEEEDALLNDPEVADALRLLQKYHEEVGEGTNDRDGEETKE